MTIRESEKSAVLRAEFFGAAAFAGIKLPVTTFAAIECPPRSSAIARVERAVIVDYGLGNLASVKNALQRLEVTVEISEDPSAILDAPALILPGVGAFGQAMDNLRFTGLVDVLAQAIEARHIPTLGICLGMQILAESSSEHGLHRGFGCLNGSVGRLGGPRNMPVPHVGWDQVKSSPNSILFEGIPADASFYFDHSFALRECSHAVANCDYDGVFVAAVERANLMAVQFHPEKSQAAGLRILANFLAFAARVTR